MNNLVTVALGISIAMLLLTMWANACLIRTHNQRIMIISRRTRDRWNDEAKAFSSVSFDAHWWSLCTFRDPRKLYPSIVWRQMEWK